MINYKAYEIIKEYAAKRYRISFEELYFIDAIREFYPMEDLMALEVEGQNSAVDRFNTFVADMYYGYLDSPYASSEMYMAPLYADPDGFRLLCMKESHFNSDAWLECLSHISSGTRDNLINKYYFGYLNKHRNYYRLETLPEIAGHKGPWKPADYYKTDKGEMIIMYEDTDGSKVITDKTGKLLSVNCSSILDYLHMTGEVVF